LTFDILFLKDIQDVWLFSHFIENAKNRKIKLYFMIETTEKVSAVQRWPKFVGELGINQSNMILFEGENSNSFKRALESCRYFITKDFLPFESITGFAKKLIVLSWVGESANRSPHIYNKKFAQPGYARLYCEKLLTQVYEHMGFESDSRIPKYYFLNKKSRKDLCEIIGLDPEKKYITVFNNMWFNGDATKGVRKNKLALQTREIYDHIISKARNKGYEVIIKNKMKYDASNYKSVPESYYDKYSPGTPSLYHTGIVLMSLSEFSVGLATSASVESEHIGSRFISFWKHDHASGKALFEDIASGSGQCYRLAQGKNTFNVGVNDNLADIIDNLEIFIDSSSSTRDFYFEKDDFIEREL